jgi:hypothetical protein
MPGLPNHRLDWPFRLTSKLSDCPQRVTAMAGGVMETFVQVMETAAAERRVNCNELVRNCFHHLKVL